MFSMKMNLSLAVTLLGLVTVVGCLHGHSFFTSVLYGALVGIVALAVINRKQI